MERVLLTRYAKSFSFIHILGHCYWSLSKFIIFRLKLAHRQGLLPGLSGLATPPYILPQFPGYSPLLAPAPTSLLHPGAGSTSTHVLPCSQGPSLSAATDPFFRIT